MKNMSEVLNICFICLVAGGSSVHQGLLSLPTEVKVQNMEYCNTEILENWRKNAF